MGSEGENRAQRQRSHSSAAQTHQQHSHRGSIGSGIINGLRKVHLFQRPTMDNSRIRQPLMAESQAVSITPHHHQQRHHLATSNAGDCLIEMTTDVNATIEEENVDATMVMPQDYDAAQWQTDATTEPEATFIIKATQTMPMTTTKSYQNTNSNTTTASVSISTATTTTTATATITTPSATPFITSTASFSSSTIAAATELAPHNRNGHTIRAIETHPPQTAASIFASSLSSNKDIASCAGGGGNLGGGLVLVTTTNNNLSLHDRKSMVDETL